MESTVKHAVVVKVVGRTGSRFPRTVAACVLLSNVCAKMGKWSEVRRVRDVTEERGIKKVPGCSLVEVGGDIHEFFVGDDSHPETREICMLLDEIMKRLKMRGFVGNTSKALLQLDEEGKELAHSEKLIGTCHVLFEDESWYPNSNSKKPEYKLRLSRCHEVDFPGVRSRNCHPRLQPILGKVDHALAETIGIL